MALLVLTTDEATARWAAEPIPLGPSRSQITPLVLGPQDVPRVDSTEEALQAPALAVLSAITHAPEPESVPVVLAGLEALRSGAFGAESERFFYDFIRNRMDVAARRALEQLMKIEGYQYQTEFARRYVAEGKAEGLAEGQAKGRAELVLHLLERRSIAFSAEQAELIRSCRDENQLLVWLDRALAAKTISDVLES